MKELYIYTDGGARGNPWDAGIWVFITDNAGKEIERRYKYLWTKTNNEAEYTWALYGIKRGIELWASSILLHMDSQLVINQLNGEWKIKKDELKSIYHEIEESIKNASVQVEFRWIEREKNKEADRLSNVAMDKK